MKSKCLLAFSIITLSASAQQKEINLDPVTISTSLKPIPVSRSGRNITTISGDYFDKLPVYSIDELLRYLPGVEVQMRGPAGSQSDIVLRGGTFQQVLVILDGLRLNDPNTGHFNSYIPIAPAEIEKVEILKGAASAIYGSDAVGGVILVTTKTFAAKQGKTKKQFGLQGTGGQYGLWLINSGGLYQNRNTAIAGGFLSNNSTGQLQRGTRGYFNNNTVSISASHHFNKNWQLSLRSAYDSRDFAVQNFYTTYISDTAKEKVQSFWNQLNLTFQKAKNRFILDAGYKNVKDQYAYNTGSTPNKNISELVQFTSRYEHDFSKHTGLTTGIQFQNKRIRSNDRGDHNLSQYAAFIILNQDFAEKLFLTPAIRVDHTEQSGTQFVPQMNLSYKIKNIQLRAGAGKTIREANFTEQYNNYNKALVTSGSIGNPGLQAECSFSYEAGIDFFLKNMLKISSGFFRREQSRLIDWVTTPYSQMPRKENLSPAGTYALATNIASVNTSGFETDLQFQRSLPHQQRVMANTGFLWLDSKTTNGIQSFYISSHAKFLVNFNAEYSNKRFSLSASGIYKNRKPQEAAAINAQEDANCFMLNTKLAVFLWHQKLSLFMELDNVFDNTCGDLLGAQLPGRWFMSGLKFQFEK
ncbi:MAG: TonB-dependent receptor [Ferruginibacter sp.]|nr:TonB-dependent receptor [Bacteroidota bacterium]MBX2920175.1 TonB-dependent receptor [Ferruginibacter sp.]